VIEDGVSGSVLSAQPNAEELADRVAHWLRHTAAGSAAARAAAERHDAVHMLERMSAVLDEVRA
jgi:hypothetical protein